MLNEKELKIKNITRVKDENGLEDYVLLGINNLSDEEINTLMDSKIMISEIKSKMRKN